MCDRESNLHQPIPGAKRHLGWVPYSCFGLSGDEYGG